MHLAQTPRKQPLEDRQTADAQSLTAPSPRVPDSFREVFDAHIAMVWRLLRAMGVEPSQVEDVAQEAFMVVFEKLGEFEGRSKLSTWICSIAYRVGANARRKAKRLPNMIELEPAVAEEAPTPEEASQGAEFVRTMARYCASLPEGMRDVFVMCFVEELTLRETAEILQISINTVASRVRLLRAALRETLELTAEPSP